MKDEFARLIGPVLQYVLGFRRRLARGESPPLGEVRGSILALLDEAGRKAGGSRELAGVFSLARHALVYWADEVMIDSDWPGARDWRDHILEWDYFGERLGGEAFFDKAREAEARAGTDPLETFLLCVALGFRGKYAGDRPGLRAWAERVHGRILRRSPRPAPFPAGGRSDGGVGGLRPLPGGSALLAVSVLVSITALVTLACFILTAHLTG